MSTVVIIVGVSGSGKSEVGQALASQLGWKFHEGDAFHPQANVQKMQAGQPLDDADRRPWLEALRKQIQADLTVGRDAVMACSALKKGYRQTLVQVELKQNDRVTIVSLNVSRSVLEARLKNRTGHFFNPSLLNSQLETWEPATEADLQIDGSEAVDEIVKKIVKQIAAKV